MKLELTTKQFRRLLDMAYIGNWILNSTRGDDRFKDYDDVESLLFAKAREEGMGVLAEDWQGEVVPSRAFAEGGIHEAIMEYENNVFFDILAEDLARRDMEDASIDQNNYEELSSRIDAYIAEFEQHGTANILVDSDPLSARHTGAANRIRGSPPPFCSVHVSWSIQIGNSTPYTVSRESRPASMVPPGPSRTVTVQTVSDRYSASASFSRKRASASSAQAAS